MKDSYDPYKKFGLTRVINAATCLTRLGGSMPDPEVFRAMEDASKGFIRIPVLQKWAGERIAEALGTEAALPTCGAANALMLAAAACIFRGTDLENYDPLENPPCIHLIQRLPLNTKGLKTEFVVMKNDRNVYDHSVECAGGRFIEAGSMEKVSEEDLIEAFNQDRAAAYYYTVQTPKQLMPIESFTKIAHERGVPVIVDAAPNLTHKDVPKRLIRYGVDLMIFSGGKQLGGPNNTGILAGRSDLVKLAHLNAYPFDGVGRGAKMSRETILGLVKALEIWMERNDEAYYGELEVKSQSLSESLNQIPGIASGVIYEPTVIPELSRPSYTYIELEKDPGISLKELYKHLLDSDPPIEALYEPFFITAEAKDKITIKAEYLLPGDDEIIIERIKKIMKTY